jgi:hypothetical protein
MMDWNNSRSSVTKGHVTNFRPQHNGSLWFSPDGRKAGLVKADTQSIVGPNSPGMAIAG